MSSIHKFIHAHIHTCVCSYTHACTHTQIHTYTHTYTHAHAFIHTYIHSYIHRAWSWAWAWARPGETWGAGAEAKSNDTTSSVPVVAIAWFRHKEEGEKARPMQGVERERGRIGGSGSRGSKKGGGEKWGWFVRKRND